jgi:Transposase DDE domain group 1
MVLLEPPGIDARLNAACSPPGSFSITVPRRRRHEHPCASERVDVPTLPRCGERFSSDLFAARWYWDTTAWSRRRRVVGKAEHNRDGANPRFVVTSLARSRYAARALYEDLYCARGEAENRIGEQFELFADRASSATMPANQLRMWFSAMAYVLVDSLRRIGLRHTQFADAAVATIRLKLLKLGAQVRSSVRRLHFALASGCPNKVEFEMAYLYLRRTFNSS